MTENIKTISDKTFSVLMRKVYKRISFALLIKGGIPYLVAFIPNVIVINTVITNQFLFYGLLITDFVLVVWISAALHKLSSLQATAIIFPYTIIKGATSCFLLEMIYKSIQTALFIALGICAIMYLWGKTTKANLSTMGKLCTIGLFGLILATIVNLFLNNGFLMMILSYIGVIVFVGLTAYDAQKIKTMLCQAEEHDEDFDKLALMGALTDCLNFINLFIYMLSILSRYDSCTNFTTSL